MGETRGDAAEAGCGPDGRPGGADAPRERREEGEGVTRRQFAAGAGATLLLPVAARLSPWTVSGTGAGTGIAPPAAAPAETRSAQEAEEEPPGTEALTRYVEARWGDRLSEEDREEIRDEIAGNLQAASALDDVPLENGDGPAFAFRPYRGSET